MADLYRVIYVNKSKEQVAVMVSATSEKNAVAAAKSNDANFQTHATATAQGISIIAGS